MSGKIITFILLLLILILINGCVQSEIPVDKYCEQDSDCLTSCGTEIGDGGCYNKDSFDFDEKYNLRIQKDDTCCVCDYVSCDYCVCVNNICIIKEGDCV